VRPKPKEGDTEEQELRPLIDTERQFVLIYLDPKKPIS